MKIITCTAGAFALVLAACGGYTPIGEGEPTGGTSGAGGTSMSGGTGGTSTMTGGTGGGGAPGSGGTATMTGGTGGTATMTGGTGGTSTMTGGTGGTGMYDPCANRACGTTCSVCDPNDMTCAADAVITYCDDGGNCTPAFPMCETNECETSMDCAVDLACAVCSDGSTACPTSECVNGQCVTSYPTCPGQTCMTAAECPVSDAPCTMCLDGSTVCPWSDCVNGVCTSGIDSCGDASPCDGKSCGDLCTPCAGSNCAAVPVMAASYCDENLDCVFNVPMCTTHECKVDMDCLAPDICMACPETGDCAVMQCINGGCQWQCAGTDECGGCGHEQVCVYQAGGPGPSVGYTCATVGTCDVAENYCMCVEGQGMCQQSESSKYCQCDNGLD